MALKLNSLSREIFAVKGDHDTKVSCNGTTISRNDIVSAGRLVAVEYVGKKLNSVKDACKIVGDRYESRLPEGTDYATVSKKFGDKKFLFCATQAYKAVGKDAPTLEEAKRDVSLASDSTFLRTMAAIDRDVLNPIVFSVFDDVSANGLMQWEAVPMGGTKEITVQSNDVFLFEDSAFGSLRSTSKNYLYAKTVTLTPKAYACNATIKWYADVVNGEAGRYYAAIINGMWNKIYAIFVSTLTTAASGNVYIPSALKANSYTTAGWLTVTENLAAASGVRRTDLLAFGKASALANLLPVDSTGGAITGLQYGLGEQWFYQGYLPKAGGVDVVEVSPVIVPGTQNTSLDTIDLGNTIYVVAKGGYAPIFGAYAEGSPMTLTASASETADLTIDINVSAFMDFAPVFASKVAAITSVYPST